MSAPAVTQLRRGHGRDAIISAALAVIASRGLHALTLRDVAEVADLSLGSTTYHFASRDDLILTALTHHVEQLEEECRSAIADADPSTLVYADGQDATTALLAKFTTCTTTARFSRVTGEMYAEASRSVAVAGLRGRATTARRWLLTEAAMHAGLPLQVCGTFARWASWLADGMVVQNPCSENLASDVLTAVTGELRTLTDGDGAQ